MEETCGGVRTQQYPSTCGLVGGALGYVSEVDPRSGHDPTHQGSDSRHQTHQQYALVNVKLGGRVRCSGEAHAPIACSVALSYPGAAQGIVTVIVSPGAAQGIVTVIVSPGAAQGIVTVIVSPGAAQGIVTVIVSPGAAQGIVTVIAAQGCQGIVTDDCVPGYPKGLLWSIVTVIVYPRAALGIVTVMCPRGCPRAALGIVTVIVYPRAALGIVTVIVYPRAAKGCSGYSDSDCVPRAAQGIMMTVIVSPRAALEYSDGDYCTQGCSRYSDGDCVPQGCPRAAQGIVTVIVYPGLPKDYPRYSDGDCVPWGCPRYSDSDCVPRAAQGIVTVIVYPRAAQGIVTVIVYPGLPKERKMADLSISTTTGSQNCVEGVRVFEEYSLHLLPHNPAWLTTAPAWVTSLSLPHHTLLANIQKWSQELSWKTHLSEEDRRGVAPPLRVGVNQMYGRHLVAARDMRAGEVVLVEPPLLLALRAKSPPYCSRCYRRAEHFTCPGCGFFLCGVECMTESHQEECAVFRRLGLADPPQDERQKEEELMCERVAAMPSEQRAQAQALLQQARKTALQQRRLDVLRQYMVQPAVRTLLTMNQSDLKRKLILSLQGNSDTGSQRYRINQKRIVDVVINQLQAATDPTLVHQVCSVWDTNGFEVPLGWGTRVHGLYPLASLLTHDCRANTQQWFTADGHLVLRAVDHIPEGSVLTTCYTDPQWATLLRQDHLRVSKQFTCTCTRCLDPTEMGTFMGSPLCQGCGGPLVSSAPLDPKSDWICHSRCPHTATAK
ncbi:SET domain-containing protein SmydA-8-like 8, partial [Homarus americanus]